MSLSPALLPALLPVTGRRRPDPTSRRTGAAALAAGLAAAADSWLHLVEYRPTSRWTRLLPTRDAAAALDAGAAGVGDGAVWADLNTGSPGLKQRLHAAARERGIRFADVAIMAPVPGRGLRTPMLACGEAADDVARLLNPLGASVEVLPGEPGAAAARKLLRSVFFKGLAAAVVEALEAAKAIGKVEVDHGDTDCKTPDAASYILKAAKRRA